MMVEEAIKSLATDSGVVSSPVNLGGNALTDSTKNWATDVHKNRLVKITSGSGSGQLAVIDGNSSNTLIIRGTWPQAIGAGATYVILEKDLIQILRDVLGGGTNVNITAEFDELKGGQHPVMWVLGTYIEGFKREAPNLANDVIDAVYSHDGEKIIVGDRIIAGFPLTNALYEVDKKYNIFWELGSGLFSQVCSLDYNPLNDRVLVAVIYLDGSRRIIEVKDGVIVNGPLTGTTLGTFGPFNTFSSGGITYDRIDPTHFWLADPDHHVVVKTSWDGVVDKQFGVWDTPGADATHLRYPSTVSHHGPGNVFICDYGNHRILNVGISDMLLDAQLPHPSPSARLVGTYEFWSIAIFSGNIRIAGLTPPAPYPLPTYIYPEWGAAWTPLMILPVWCNSVCQHPKEHYRMLLNAAGAQEVNLAHFPTSWIKNWRQTLWAAKAVMGGTTYYSAPILDYGFDDQSITILLNQSGTFDIQAARFMDSELMSLWTGDWDSVITPRSFSADKMFCYTKDFHLGVYRIAITPSAKGILSGGVESRSKGSG